MSYPSTPASLISSFLSVILALTLSSCVGRGKYLEALLVQEAAKSEAASAKTDLADAARRYAALEAELAQTRADYAQQRSAAYEQQSGGLSERQELLRQRTLQSLLVDSLRRERERLSAQRANAMAILERKAEQLAELRKRVAARSGNFLPGQLEMTTRGGALRLSIDERAIFDERSTPRISDFGDASLSNLAGALGGRSDITVDIVCLPRTLDGSAKARREAANRAALVASNLVIDHGMLPRVVRAVGVRVDGETAAVVGLVEESEAPPRLEIVLRVAGDWAGEVRRALE